MQVKVIEYNKLFEVIREKEQWILSKRKTRKGAPIFDIEEGKWCSIETSRNKQWFILFYRSKDKNGKPAYYKSFAQIQGEKLTFSFDVFNEVVRESTGLWVSKSGGFIKENAIIGG